MIVTCSNWMEFMHIVCYHVDASRPKGMFTLSHTPMAIKESLMETFGASYKGSGTSHTNSTCIDTSHQSHTLQKTLIRRMWTIAACERVAIVLFSLLYTAIVLLLIWMRRALRCLGRVLCSGPGPSAASETASQYTRVGYVRVEVGV